MARKFIGSTGSRPRRWLFLLCLVVTAGTAMLFITGALGSPEGNPPGVFALDKNATHNLTTLHVGVNQNQIKATDTSIGVCEYTSDHGNTPTVTNGDTLLVDGERMTFTGYGSTSTHTGGCSFTDPTLTASQVRVYNVTRTAGVAHAGDSDITLLTTVGALPGNDWDQVYQAVHNNPTAKNACSSATFQFTAASAVACDFVSDPPGVTIFTGGSSDIGDVNTWTCTNQAVPDADEILHAYAIKYSDTDQFLYFGADRYATNGSKDFGFWFFKNPISSSGPTITNTCPTGAFSGGLHSEGDILLLGTFTQGGAVSTIRAFKWVTSGGDVSTHLLTEGTFGDCVPGLSSDKGCSTVNNSTIPLVDAIGGNPTWDYQGKGGAAANVIYSGGFMEGGVDLGAIGLTGCFSSFMAETRSSPSLTAELKDFTIGKFEACGANVTTTPKASDGTTDLSADSNSNNLIETSIGTGSVDVKDSALLEVTGTGSFTGTLKFYICGPLANPNACDVTINNDGSVTTNGVAAGSQTVTANATYTSNAVTLTSAGRYCWAAAFISGTTGVPNTTDTSIESSSGTGECFEVLPVKPTVPTVAVTCDTRLAITSTVNFGTSICDKGTLTGSATQPGTNGGSSTYPSINATNGANAGGKITFTLRGADTPGPPPVCSSSTAGISAGTNPEDVTPISGDGAYYTTGATPSSPGQYHWVAAYTAATGDPNNQASDTYNADCSESAEAVTVQRIDTTISTTQKVYPQDSATITSSVSGDTLPAGGTVTFYLYGGDTAANNLTNCQAYGTTVNSGGLIDKESFSTASTPAHSEPFNTNNTTAAVNTNTTVYWRVTYATGDSAHTGRQSDCAESTQTVFANDTGPGTLFP
jgi:hypothetical protein